MKATRFKMMVFVLSILFCFALSSCVVVKPYQKAFINDTDMQLGDKTLDNFDNNFRTYREGVSGGNGSKSGGGCGCN